MATNDGRNMEEDIKAVVGAALGNSLVKPEDAWIVLTATIDAENDGYGPGYAYVRRSSPSNTEWTATQIKPSLRKYIVDGLCVRIERIPKNDQGVEWRATDFGVGSWEQYAGTVPAEPVSDDDLSANVMLLDAAQTNTAAKTFNTGTLIATSADLNTPDIDGGTVDSITTLTVVSTTAGSIPMPVMTEAQRDAILSPPEGAWVFNSDTGAPNYYDGATWNAAGVGSTVDATNVTYTPSAPTQWPDPDPTTAQGALDSLADQVDTLTGLVGGGAPDTANYVVGVASAGLSAETVIPGLRGSADIAGAAGGGVTEEYDTATPGLTWSPSSPATVDSNTTILSHLYVRSTDTTERFGLRAWSPAGAFDVRCKIEVWNEFAAANYGGGSLCIADAANTSRVIISLGRFSATNYYDVAAYTYAGGAYTQRGSTWTVGSNVAYLRIVRDGSNNVSFWWSSTGNSWQFIATVAFVFTPTQLGHRIGSTAANYGFASDWLRTNV